MNKRKIKLKGKVGTGTVQEKADRLFLVLNAGFKKGEFVEIDTEGLKEFGGGVAYALALLLSKKFGAGRVLELISSSDSLKETDAELFDHLANIQQATELTQIMNDLALVKIPTAKGLSKK